MATALSMAAAAFLLTLSRGQPASEWRVIRNAETAIARGDAVRDEEFERGLRLKDR